PKAHFREPVLSLEKLLEDFERMTFYVYKSKGRIVGVAALQIGDDEMGRIHWVYILPEHQRRGVGTALMTHLERRAREIGLRRLRLLTVGKANWAVNFYKKLGYNLTDKIERPWGLDVFLEKELQPSQQDTDRDHLLGASCKGRSRAVAHHVLTLDRLTKEASPLPSEGHAGQTRPSRSQVSR
ncbi:MAG: GNAT family N-acetyltransferase, partial [Chloroflexi bacterium]|nr:GNAT family N-acetyltransferase [Chloroflexota bacterium]